MAYDVSNGLVAVNVLLHDTILVDTNGREQIERALVARVDTVENQADDDLLPSWASLVPELGLLQVDNVADVLHDTVQSTGGEDLVFVVVCHSNQKLSMAVVHGRTQIVAVLQGEVVGVTCRGRVWQLSASHPQNTQFPSPTAHVCKLLAAALEVVAVLGLDGVLDSRRHGVVCRQDGALHELDLTGHAALETAGSSDSTAGLLALSPGLGRAGLAPLVGGGRPVGSAKLSSRLVAACRRVDIRPAVSLAGVLCRAVGRVCLGQTVGRVWAVLRVAVEGVVVGACRILVQKRATDLVLIVPAGSVLGSSLAFTVDPGHDAGAGHALRCYGRPRSFAGCTP